MSKTNISAALLLFSVQVALCMLMGAGLKGIFAQAISTHQKKPPLRNLSTCGSRDKMLPERLLCGSWEAMQDSLRSTLDILLGIETFAS